MMKEIYSKIIDFFDRKFFYAAFIYLLMAALAGEFAGEFRERHIFARWDWQIAQYFLSVRSDFLTAIMKSITFFGDAKFVIAAMIIILFSLTFNKKYVYSIALSLSAAVSFATSFLLKDIFSRPRPQGHQLIVESGFSFPSGHAIIAVALYGMLAYFLVKYFENKYAKIVVGFVGFAVIAAIGVSRVYLGVHWPSDVIGSYIFGGIWLGIIIWLVRKSAQEKQMRV